MHLIVNRRLLDVLYLFLDAVDQALHVDHSAGDGRVIGFAADGVDFAQHFLGQEIEFSADVLVAVAQLLELIEVAGASLCYMAGSSE